MREFPPPYPSKSAGPISAHLKKLQLPATARSLFTRSSTVHKGPHIPNDAPIRALLRNAESSHWLRLLSVTRNARCPPGGIGGRWALPVEVRTKYLPCSPNLEVLHLVLRCLQKWHVCGRQVHCERQCMSLLCSRTVYFCEGNRVT